MTRWLLMIPLLASAACQPLYEGAGGAQIKADCMQSADQVPPTANVRISCVTIITSGATSNTPTSNATATIPVSPGIP